MLGQFESSLRGRASWSGGEDPLQKKTLHRTCSGHAHGHGVRKERTVKGGQHSQKTNLKAKYIKPHSAADPELFVYSTLDPV